MRGEGLRGAGEAVHADGEHDVRGRVEGVLDESSRPEPAAYARCEIRLASCSRPDTVASGAHSFRPW
jgi:hypothetical protein